MAKIENVPIVLCGNVCSFPKLPQEGSIIAGKKKIRALTQKTATLGTRKLLQCSLNLKERER